MAKEREKLEANVCSCTQGAVDLLKSVTPVKEGMLKEARCRGCGKAFLTNFSTDLCFDCRRENGEK
ncbi:MAG: hypothetical protein QW840_02685 [Candidatus Bathyarchaeia archaeon]